MRVSNPFRASLDDRRDADQGNIHEALELDPNRATVAALENVKSAIAVPRRMFVALAREEGDSALPRAETSATSRRNGSSTQMSPFKPNAFTCNTYRADVSSLISVKQWFRGSRRITMTLAI